MASKIINAVYNIRNKRYLELGIHIGSTFKQIISVDKTSVDKDKPADFNMTTDDFFDQLNVNEKFDVIYIDACHQYEFVTRDFNNSIQHLNVGGIIFIHDLIPPTKEMTASYYCGDGYKFLYHIAFNCNNDYEYMSLHPKYGDYGLTTFFFPKKQVNLASNVYHMQYEQFIKRLDDLNTFNEQEIMKKLGAYQ